MKVLTLAWLLPWLSYAIGPESFYKDKKCPFGGSSSSSILDFTAQNTEEL